MKLRILLIDDDPNLRRVTEIQLVDLGYQVKAADSGEAGLELFDANDYDVVVSDIVMPGLDGIEVLRKIKQSSPDSVVILMTAYGTVDDALKACSEGAADYVVKPFGIQQLVFAIEKSLRVNELERTNLSLRRQLKSKFSAENIVGGGSKMQEVLRLVDKVAPSESTVFILGESGTGKELIAKAVHFNSRRAKKNFVTVNCASIPENLIESELFGHVKGAFTGALKHRVGRFEQASGGTIFLDEIGDLRGDLQAKLLRALQEREIRRVGGDDTIPLDIRVIAATHHDLEARMKDGTFREDLYYRLSVVPIILPPLRERSEDIPDLVRLFIHRYAGDRRFDVDEDAMSTLKSYHYPGNVRELENIIERAITLADTNVISSREIMTYLQKLPEESKHASAATTLPDMERDAIIYALRASGGNQTRAAEALGIPRHVLIYRLKKYGISKV